MKENDVNMNEKTAGMNPVAPMLIRGLVKLHKECRLTRRIVNCIHSSPYEYWILGQKTENQEQYKVFTLDDRNIFGEIPTTATIVI